MKVFPNVDFFFGQKLWFWNLVKNSSATLQDEKSLGRGEEIKGLESNHTLHILCILTADIPRPTWFPFSKLRKAICYHRISLNFWKWWMIRSSYPFMRGTAQNVIGFRELKNGSKTQEKVLLHLFDAQLFFCLLMRFALGLKTTKESSLFLVHKNAAGISLNFTEGFLTFKRSWKFHIELQKQTRLISHIFSLIFCDLKI